MSSPFSIPQIERPDFVHGQQLLPEDMRSIQDYQREVRWLHNRTLHDWGIAIGFRVRGRAGDREVVVEPGYALDCRGRDIVLAEEAPLQVPAVSGAATGGPKRYLLTASWLPDGELVRLDSRAGVCEGGGAVRRREAPALRWLDPMAASPPESRYHRGIDIVLASVFIQDCALAADPSTSERRSARAETAPYVATGRTDPARTVWNFYPAWGALIGIEAVVDTSGAGFQRTPTYMASVTGSRLMSSPGGTSVPGVLLEGFVSVAEPRPDSFRLRVTLPRNINVTRYLVNPSSVFVATMLERLRTQLEWSVSWIGLEG